MAQKDYETYRPGDWHLQSDSILPYAQIAYKTFGDPKSPAIVYPTWYSGGQLPMPNVLCIFLTRLINHCRQRLADRWGQNPQS